MFSSGSYSGEKIVFNFYAITPYFLNHGLTSELSLKWCRLTIFLDFLIKLFSNLVNLKKIWSKKVLLWEKPVDTITLFFNSEIQLFSIIRKIFLDFIYNFFIYRFKINLMRIFSCWSTTKISYIMPFSHLSHERKECKLEA